MGIHHWVFSMVTTGTLLSGVNARIISLGTALRRKNHMQPNWEVARGVTEHTWAVQQVSK